MPDHPWIENPDGTITCPLCNLTRPLAFGKHKPRGLCPKAKADGTPSGIVGPARSSGCGGCGQQNKPLPSPSRRLANFGRAVGRDLKNGRRRRTGEQIARLFAAHCDRCPEFNRERGACAQCGCPVSPLAGPDVRNKLAVESERCPIGQWPYGEITRRNLLFYILPLRHSLGVWQWHVAQLRKYLSLFNGRRIVTIATKGPGETLDVEPAERVRQAFAEDAASIEFVERPNDPALWETPAFRAMLGMIQSAEPGEASWYFHAKGVRRAKQEAIRLWCEEIYRHNLGRADEVAEALRYWKCCGIARSRTTPGKLEIDCPWHYAGTAFWFRHDQLFAAPNWSEIVDHSHAVEAYLGTQFAHDDAYCLAHDEIAGVYDEATWRRSIEAHDAAPQGAAKQLKISIVVAARNYGRYLADALESCLWQSLPAHQVIYVDDGSDDGSADAARTFPSVEVVELPDHPGVIAARNAGAERATGDALVFLDGDDVLPVDYLAKMAAKLSPETPFVYSDMQCFGREQQLIVQPEFDKHDLRTANICNTSSLIWREAFERAGRWQSGEFGRMPDWHLFLRLAHFGPPRRAPVALGYRKHGQSWSDRAHARETAADRARIRQQILASVDAWAAAQ